VAVPVHDASSRFGVILRAFVDDMNAPPPLKLRNPALAWLGFGVVVAASMVVAYAWSERLGFEQLDDVAQRQLDLYASTLESELGKHAYLPSLIEMDPDIEALFEAPDNPVTRANAGRKLASFKVRASAITTFALDPAGTLLASSEDYRTLAGDAGSVALPSLLSRKLQAQRSQVFVANADSGASEYYFAQPVRRDALVVGIVGVKLSLDPLEATWMDLGVRSESEKLLVIDEEGVIIMSSVRQWKYRSVGTNGVEPPLLRYAEQYPRQPIRPLNMVVEKPGVRGARQVRIWEPDGRFSLHMAQERDIPLLGWRVMILSDPRSVWRNARYAAWGGGAFAAFLGLLALYIWQRRRALRQISLARNALQEANAQLETKVARRTDDLRLSNDELVNEMRERQLAQDELVQAGKLAVLGQMSAGISHEINQPLTALRALAKNTSMLLAAGRMADVDENLKAISEVTERMGGITAQLKSFARKSPGTHQPVSLVCAVQYMQRLLEHRFRAEQVRVDVNLSGEPLVCCDLNRLEQVLVNLAGNALDAMRDQTVKVLTISTLPAEGQRIRVRVEDTGVGLPDELLARLFEPFFTTKASGEGLGLGLVISSHIVREFGGTLRAHKGPQGLAFEFDLELVQGENHV
jgi:two-component system C4-dicarboxylate transport sensor histidine kinase DctB